MCHEGEDNVTVQRGDSRKVDIVLVKIFRVIVVVVVHITLKEVHRSCDDHDSVHGETSCTYDDLNVLCVLKIAKR